MTTAMSGRTAKSFWNVTSISSNLSRIPTRKLPSITDEPLIWRYFVTPLPTRLAASQLDEHEFTHALRHPRQRAA